MIRSHRWLSFTARYKIFKVNYSNNWRRDARDTQTGQNKHRGAVWHEKLRLMLGKHYLSKKKTTSEKCIVTYSCHARMKNAYFNHLACVGTVSLSAICPFVSNSIVTFPKESVCVCVDLYISANWCVCVCYHWRAHMLVYLVCGGCQTSIWLESIAKVRWRSILHR